ncbi:MAG: hypothetical protein AAF211_09135 [Myxococcota bacterium]
MDEHVVENRRYWNAYAPQWVARGEESWAASEPFWGIWRTPEAELGMLPERMDGLDAIELGCGTAYVSAWMARRIDWTQVPHDPGGIEFNEVFALHKPG